MNKQLGSIISSIANKPIYQAAHPGNIYDYNLRHAFLKYKKPNASYIYLVYEGNDFYLPSENSNSNSQSKPWHFLRSIYVPVFEAIRNMPLHKLLSVTIEANKSNKSEAKPSSTLNASVVVKNLPNTARKQAFLTSTINMTMSDISFAKNDLDYIFKNKDSICAVVFAPTSYSVYIDRAPFSKRHPQLDRQFKYIENTGIKVVNLTSMLRKSATNENIHQPLWWADDTHWRSHGIMLAAEHVVRTTRCIR